MSQISLTASMRSNLLSLQGTSALMSQTQERLATGKKVNSAIDNPSSFYTAQSLSNRANDLNGLLDSMGQAISTIKAANEGIESITSFVEQAKAVANNAFETTDSTTRSKYEDQFNDILDQIDRLAKDSGYKGINLLQGDKLTVTFNEDRSNKIDVQGQVVNYTNLGMEEQDWNALEKQAVKDAQTALDTAQSAYDTEKAKGTDESKIIADAVTGTGDAAKLKKGVALAKGDIVTDGTKYYRAKEAIAADPDSDRSLVTEGVSAKVELVTKSDKDGLYYNATDKSGAEEAYDDLTEAQNTYDSALKAALDEVSEAIQKAIDSTTTAIDTLRTYASEFGNNYAIVQTRENFTTSLINVLEEGADKLTLADMNEESANMLALQTRQQLAINSLSLASQASQSVLKLFS